LVEYLGQKICGQQLVDPNNFKSWLGAKRSTSKEAKSRGKLLGKKYRCLMQSCLQNWTSMYFNPNIQTCLQAGKIKFFWMQSNLTFANMWKQIGGHQTSDNIFGMEHSIKFSPVFEPTESPRYSSTVLRQFTNEYLENISAACSAISNWHRTIFPKSNNS
jgi:hypothetical protein